MRKSKVIMASLKLLFAMFVVTTVIYNTSETTMGYYSADRETLNTINALLAGITSPNHIEKNISDWSNEELCEAMYYKILNDDYLGDTINLKYREDSKGKHYDLGVLQRVAQDAFGRELPDSFDSWFFTINENDVILHPSDGECYRFIVQNFYADKGIAEGIIVHEFPTMREFEGYFKAVLEKKSSSIYGYTLVSVEIIEENQKMANLKATASCELQESTITHAADNLNDGNLATAWVESKKGLGIGEWVKLSTVSGNKINISAVEIFNGYHKSDAHLWDNGQVHQVLIECENGYQQKVNYVSDSDVIVLDNTVKTSWIKFTILNARAGEKYEDVCISEIRLRGLEGDTSKNLQGDTLLSGWKKAYFDFILQDRNENETDEDWEYVDYQLIYLDEDDIPELWIEYSSYASGCRLVTYHESKCYEDLLGYSTLYYLEKQNVFLNSGGIGGLYHDDIYSLKDGRLIELGVGINMTTMNPDGTQNWDVFTYEWNGKTVEEQEYENNIKQLIDVENAKKLEKGYSYQEFIDYLIGAEDKEKEESVDDGKVNYEDTIELKAYTAFPESTIGTGQEVKIQFSLYVNGELAPIEEYSLGIGTPSVIESTEMVDYNGSRIITFKGLKQGVSDITFTENSTGATITISIQVEDKCNYFRCSAFPMPYESVGSIYVSDYSCKVNKEGTHDISFNAYNTSYAYGVVEVYDESGTLIRIVPLDPKSDGSGMEKVVNGFKYVWNDIVDIFDGDTPFYTKENNARHTPVELRNIPENAEIVITSDGKMSDMVVLYTGMDTFVRTVFAASSIDLKTDGQITTVKELMNALTDVMAKSIDYDETGKQITQGLIKESIESLSTVIAFKNSTDSVYDIYETMFNLLQSLEIDIESIMLNVLKGMGYSVADTLVTTLIPLYKIVNIVDQELEIAWPLTDYIFNYERGKMEIHVTKHGLQNFVANNSVTVTQQNNFSDNTVLDAYVVAETEELTAMSNSIPKEMTNYSIYNITLREKSVEVQPSGEIEVRLPVPSGAIGEKCVVYRIEKNGDTTLLPSIHKDGFITFTTPHLSYYIIGEIEKSEDSSIKKDIAPNYVPIVIIVIFSIVGLCLLILFTKHKMKNK